jgi:hypothetical protein
MMTATDSQHDEISLATIAILRTALGMDKCFAHVATKGPTEEFGGIGLSGNMTRNSTVIASDPRVARADVPHCR